MFLSIQKKSVVGIKEQIKRQVKMLIENGELKDGDLLPSARDMASILNVNRNTVTSAYKELSMEGILETVMGSGTYVKQSVQLISKKALDRLFEDAVEKAGEMGFSREDIKEHLINRISALSTDPSRKKVMVVECNDETIAYVRKKLSAELGVETTGVLIQEIEEKPGRLPKLLKEADLVVCGFNHLEELQNYTHGSDVNVVGVLYHIDAGIINTLYKLPGGMKIGMVCANQRSTESLYNSSYFSGGKELRRMLVGFNNTEKLKHMLLECDVIYATNFVYDNIKGLITHGQKLIKVQLTLDSGSIEMVREQLQL